MTTECETKTEQKLTRTQWALFFFAVLSAFFGGLFVQAVLSPLPSSSGATYDITARNDAAQALREVESLTWRVIYGVRLVSPPVNQLAPLSLFRSGRDRD
jgi:hypothetical protein